MVIEPPERDDVLEHYVAKCFGAYPKMSNAFNMTANVINKHWAKKTQILVHPNELKQAEFRDGPITSTGMAEVVRLPFGAGGVAWEDGLDEIADKLLRCSPDILLASCACPLKKGGRLAAKANYLWVVLSTWFELSDEAKATTAPKCAEIVFVPDGVERCVDFQFKSSPVLGTTVELEYLELALEWFASHVKQQWVIDSKKFAGLKAEFVVRDGTVLDVDQLDSARFVTSAQILKTVTVMGHMIEPEGSDNYLGELAALLAALDDAPAGSRVLLVFDAT